MSLGSFKRLAPAVARSARENPATGDIASDLAELGISLDQETILKWLRQGADILPPDSLDP